MKIALTTTGEDLNAPLDPRFGRAKKFLIYDTETKEYEVVDNTQNLNLPKGAGIQAAQTVASHGVKALITGHCGPKAFNVLQTAKIEIYLTDAKTVKEAIEAFESGKLQPAKTFDVEGHWI
jgi:predicted Fe-Mo cluster-binding NifX family protein